MAWTPPQPTRPGSAQAYRTYAPRGSDATPPAPTFRGKSEQHWETIGPPPVGMFALEQGRAAPELGALRARRRLRHLCYDARGWKPGLNLGPNESIREKLVEELLHLRDRHHRRVSLIGWSLGGIYARELARSHPEHVRLVITLGAPFRDISATHAARLVALGMGGRPVHESDAVRAYLWRPYRMADAAVEAPTR